MLSLARRRRRGVVASAVRRSAEIITSNVRLRNKHLYHSLLSLNERGFGEKQELGVDQRDNYKGESGDRPIQRLFRPTDRHSEFIIILQIQSPPPLPPTL